MHVQTLILGAGAAGLMAAAHAGPSTLVIDHAKAVGEKIRISGGGRCNFTNMQCGPDNFISKNKHFSKSALKRFSQWDFLDLVQKHRIPWHEKTLGQLFCDTSAKDIIQMLLAEASAATIWTRTRLIELSHDGSHFRVTIEKDGKNLDVTTKALIVATGGKSIPKMGATGLAYDIAAQFGHPVTETRAGLVPFTFPDGRFSPLSGLSLPVRGETGGQAFEEALLFTHRGLSGPAILQLSSYWREGQDVALNLLPGSDVVSALKAARQQTGKRNLTTGLATMLPEKLVTFLAGEIDLTGNCGDLSNSRIDALAAALQSWRVLPQGTEGYRTAEVTLGGVSTDGVDSRTMMSKSLPGLFFIGECLDVTGWLGGYNFQWAWSSGVAAGQAARDVR
ncbi:NAD(P)/FAD-dependent oxidoreductase [Mesobacterium sp. TK19101]|uniref:NAD(P)/FAD-dependent oxidoreductase n=1 Tax=Mesobacterium hydrothermale TaxID=3111907 RepID=A0ABU6HLW3_9RHOB|nr:NAD(P)/FAD-dependent oxidoreductase [Mesobacterium sp. TK19101]MEC3863444.1 NAD(P)/FAD-dependent oxidoreductase [Mesobacterium sp. TK19101]